VVVLSSTTTAALDPRSSPRWTLQRFSHASNPHTLTLLLQDEKLVIDAETQHNSSVMRAEQRSRIESFGK